MNRTFLLWQIENFHKEFGQKYNIKLYYNTNLQNIHLAVNIYARQRYSNIENGKQSTNCVTYLKLTNNIFNREISNI